MAMMSKFCLQREMQKKKNKKQLKKAGKKLKNRQRSLSLWTDKHHVISVWLSRGTQYFRGEVSVSVSRTDTSLGGVSYCQEELAPRRIRTLPLKISKINDRVRKTGLWVAFHSIVESFYLYCWIINWIDCNATETNR